MRPSGTLKDHVGEDLENAPAAVLRRGGGGKTALRCRMCERGGLEPVGRTRGQDYFHCRHCHFVFTPACDEQTAGADGSSYRRTQVYTPEGRWAVDPAFLCPALERLGHRGPLRILDFGAADSIVPDLLRQGGHRVIVLAPASANPSGNHLPRPGAGCHPDRITGDIIELNIPEAQFDLTYAYKALEHVAEPRAVLRELLRLTKPGGYVLIHTAMSDIAGGAAAGESRSRRPAEIDSAACGRFTLRTFEVFVRGSSHRLVHHDAHTALIQRDAAER